MAFKNGLIKPFSIKKALFRAVKRYYHKTRKKSRKCGNLHTHLAVFAKTILISGFDQNLAKNPK